MLPLGLVNQGQASEPPGDAGMPCSQRILANRQRALEERLGVGVLALGLVKQGQIIGYVGSTGLATGPNLHYEIIKDGTQINPLKLKMPKGESLKSADLQTLKQQIYGFDIETGLIRAFFTLGPNETRGSEAVAIGD